MSPAEKRARMREVMRSRHSPTLTLHERLHLKSLAEQRQHSQTIEDGLWEQNFLLSSLLTRLSQSWVTRLFRSTN